MWHVATPTNMSVQQLWSLVTESDIKCFADKCSVADVFSHMGLQIFYFCVALLLLGLSFISKTLTFVSSYPAGGFRWTLTCCIPDACFCWPFFRVKRPVTSAISETWRSCQATPSTNQTADLITRSMSFIRSTDKDLCPYGRKFVD